MAPLEISIQNGQDALNFVATLPPNGATEVVSGPYTTKIHWIEWERAAYVRLKPGEPLDRFVLEPDVPVIIGPATKVGENVFCVEHPIQLKAIQITDS